ncbi:VanZ family protein [Arthrobacter sp. H35-D1]|uniref:VanZ family protein n=1 Tax=Arthrobacter sp. H35-D1 TaxID=3046202 RepID=UPI0024B95732|nr:VanZ family protein [Arthrobacter sp. H35-D1]MDJ0315370.1 VanZ family protein [Arthrobacter sp. H35-D1]
MNTVSHKVAVILAIAYFAALAGILFWPSPVNRPIDGALMQLLQWLHGHGLPDWFIGYRKVEFAANILLFIPLGIILVLRMPRKLWWLSIVIAAAFSGAVELAQAIFLPVRVPAWSDIVANTSGAFIGAILVLVVWSLSRRRALHAARRSPFKP